MKHWLGIFLLLFFPIYFMLYLVDTAVIDENKQILYQRHQDRTPEQRQGLFAAVVGFDFIISTALFFILY